MPRHIEDSLIGRENRKSNYRKWSERAVVVGFNSETQTYDIVVTTESALGANKRSLNKTIRQVKATVPSKVQQLSPGDAVTIGYINERREHPIILGGGDNAVQNPVPVTLGARLSDEPEFGFETFPLTVEDSITGSTTTLSLDCLDLDAEDFFTNQALAKNGVGSIFWTLSGGPGVTQCEVSGQAFGPRNTSFKIAPAGTTTDTRLAYYSAMCNIATHQGILGDKCGCGNRAVGYDCDDKPKTNFDKCTFTPPGGLCSTIFSRVGFTRILCRQPASLCDPTVVVGNHPHVHIGQSGSGGDCGSDAGVALDDGVSPKIACTTCAIDISGTGCCELNSNFGGSPNNGIILDLRDELSLPADCCPCLPQIAGLTPILVTATDAEGSSASIEVPRGGVS